MMIISSSLDGLNPATAHRRPHLAHRKQINPKTLTRSCSGEDETVTLRERRKREREGEGEGLLGPKNKLHQREWARDPRMQQKWQHREGDRIRKEQREFHEMRRPRADTMAADL